MAVPAAKGSTNPKNVVDILVNRKLVTESQIQPAIEEARKSEKPIQQIIVDKQILDKTVVLKALSEEWRIKAVNLTDIEVDLDVVKVIPETKKSKLDQLVGQPVLAPGVNLEQASKELFAEMEAEWMADWSAFE